MINGAEDPMVRLNYIAGLDYANLWDNRCYVLPGCGHASFWEAPEAFNPLLARFLDQVATAPALEKDLPSRRRA